MPLKLIIIIVLLFLTILIIRDNSLTLVPFNSLVSISQPSPVLYDWGYFPKHTLFEEKYKTILSEFQNLKLAFNKQQNLAKNYTQEDEDFYKDWNTYPIYMFNEMVKGVEKYCPLTSKLVKDNDQITSAFFSVMKAGKKLPRHKGPFKGILRYHLGLDIPEGDCFIHVGNVKYSWKNGEGVLFDETYPHYVENNTPKDRVVLFMDIIRPMKTSLGENIRDMIMKFIQISKNNQETLRNYSV